MGSKTPFELRPCSPRCPPSCSGRGWRGQLCMHVAEVNHEEEEEGSRGLPGTAGHVLVGASRVVDRPIQIACTDQRTCMYTYIVSAGAPPRRARSRPAQVYF